MAKFFAHLYMKAMDTSLDKFSKWLFYIPVGMALFLALYNIFK